MIYEERYTFTAIRGTRDYLALFREKMTPKIRAAGGEPLLFLTGMVGDRDNAVLQITRFPERHGMGKYPERAYGRQGENRGKR